MFLLFAPELCKSGWTFSLDYCLKLFETPETHSVASRLCHSEDLPGSEKAHLLSVRAHILVCGVTMDEMAASMELLAFGWKAGFSERGA